MRCQDIEKVGGACDPLNSLLILTLKVIGLKVWVTICWGLMHILENIPWITRDYGVCLETFEGSGHFAGAQKGCWFPSPNRREQGGGVCAESLPKLHVLVGPVPYDIRNKIKDIIYSH